MASSSAYTMHKLVSAALLVAAPLFAHCGLHAIAEHDGRFTTTVWSATGSPDVDPPIPLPHPGGWR